MIHPATELRHINDEMGYGVFATAFIPAGTITWAKDELDRTFTMDEFRKFAPHYRDILDKYSFADVTGRLVLCWDLARFINHSCNPTCLSAGYDFEIAVRDIQPGEELTDDYGSLNLDEDFACACAAPGCRQIIRPDDMERYADEWDTLVKPLFPRMREVPQPLEHLLSEREGVQGVNSFPFRSIRHHYRPPAVPLVRS